MKDDQNCEILSALVAEESMTSYSLCKETGISVPQVNFRIEKLVAIGVVESRIVDNKTVYSVHPVLKSKESIAEIASYIESIFDVIDEAEETSVDGIKAIISFILDKTEIDQGIDRDDLISEDNKVSEFRDILQKYADVNNLRIMNVKGWTNSKIKWMALNDRKCACAPDKRVCPCPEGLEEISRNGSCKCSVFSR